MLIAQILQSFSKIILKHSIKILKFNFQSRKISSSMGNHKIDSELLDKEDKIVRTKPALIKSTFEQSFDVLIVTNKAVQN